MLKILSVFGTRPEAIKMCPLIKAIERERGMESIVCLSGQHREMLEQVMEVFGIEARYDLKIMKPGQSLFDVTTAVLCGMEQVLDDVKPDIMLVHGDTTTSYASALAAFYRGIPIGHVEAGLRTWNLRAPYPEEFNRQSVDLVSTLFFAPTDKSRDNLLHEGKDPDRIFVTGNTVIDALKTTVRSDYSSDDLTWATGSRLILLTSHRRESIGKPMEQIFRAVKRAVEDFSDVKVIFPVHRNPLVREPAERLLGNNSRIRLIEPLDPIDFHNYMSQCHIILTDSGGIQEEAPSLGKPVLVLRNVTERPEGLEAGTLELVGTDEEKIYNACKGILTDKIKYNKMCQAVNPYGDGHASERIVAALKDYFDERKQR